MVQAHIERREVRLVATKSNRSRVVPECVRVQVRESKSDPTKPMPLTAFGRDGTLLERSRRWGRTRGSPVISVTVTCIEPVRHKQAEIPQIRQRRPADAACRPPVQDRQRSHRVPGQQRVRERDGGDQRQ